MLYFPLSREKMVVERGTPMRISVRFGRLFDMRLAPLKFVVAGIELSHVV